MSLPRRALRLAGIALLWGSAAGCSGSDPAPAPGALPVEEVDRLRALGYAELAPGPADASQMGARILDPAAARPGYRLYTVPYECRAALIALDGREIRSWAAAQPCHSWMHTELLPDGDLLVVGLDTENRTDPESGRRYLMRQSWEGQVRWRTRIRAHHDVEQVEGGEIRALSRRRRFDYAADPEAVLVDCQVVRLSGSGQPQESISLYDLTRDNAVGFALQPVAPLPGTRIVDLFHCNSLESLGRPALAGRHPLYAPDHVLISLRHQDAIVVVDLNRRELLYAWGRGQLSGPHDARALDDGKLLVFDNGLSRGWSRVIQVDPRTGEVEWQYGDSSERRFYTADRGSSQRLPGGNTLVASSDSGEAFEVTPAGRRVWQFWNPRLNAQGRRKVISRMVHYESPGIARRMELGGP